MRTPNSSATLPRSCPSVVFLVYFTSVFEAYQDVAALADVYEPARLLRDCLETVPSCYQQ